MIDLHTHTLLSDGELLPSELVRRALVKGYTAIALTDHVDSSNIDFVLPRIVKVSRILNKDWKDIFVIPGLEITHAPLEEIPVLVKFARKNGAKIVVVHGETVAEPVIPGTNRRAIEAGCDILAHPGMIKEEDVKLAVKNGVALEITARNLHSSTDSHVYGLGKACGAKMTLNTDSHSPDDLISDKDAENFLTSLGMSPDEVRSILRNSEDIVTRIKARC
ncbi:MAG: histidinol phosphate phosphatase domain-containing protein [Candidatus Omnitrophica bacterium]|nr:histidinol phosphate phosphatase domain-containing protein [Candidatus Omnitrophota bacterium]